MWCGAMCTPEDKARSSPLQTGKLELRVAERCPSSYNMPRLESGSPGSRSVLSVLVPRAHFSGPVALGKILLFKTVTVITLMVAQGKVFIA